MRPSVLLVGLRQSAGLLSRSYLAFALGLVLWSLCPALLGWQSTVVTSGSMAPLIAEGGVLVSSPVDPDDLVTGQVVLYADSARDGGLVSHRVVGRDTDGLLLTRGDANASTDSTPVPAGAVRAVGRLYVPFAGRPLLWLWDGQWLPVLAWSALTAGAVLLAGHRQPPTPALVAGPAVRAVRRPGRRGRSPRAASAGATVLLALAGVSGVQGSDAAFTAATRNPGNQLALHPSAQFGTSGYQALVLADGPLIYYGLDEAAGPTAVNAGSGGAADNGTYGASQVTYGVAPDATPREGGSAVTLAGTSGTNGCVRDTRQITAPPTTFSLEAWFRTTTTAGGTLIGFGNDVGVDSTSMDRMLYLTPAGRVRFGANATTPATVVSTSVLNDGAWHHVVGTLGPSGTTLYVDGVQQATSPANTSGTTPGYWHVGCDQPPTGWTGRPSSDWFLGSVDNVAIYPTVLTLTQVQAHWFGA